jgi:hypothetical protein
MGGSMIQKFGFAGLLGLALMGGVAPASAVGPIAPAVSVQRDLLDASFFGRPYPYGYTGWGPCIRYVEVQTPWGPRLRRVRVCR